MCGRFTQAYTWAEVHEFLSVFGPPRNLRPRYNVSPTTQIDVVRAGEPGRELESWRRRRRSDADRGGRSVRNANDNRAPMSADLRRRLVLAGAAMLALFVAIGALLALRAG